MSRPWMPLYIGDYLKDTGHLTTLQHGAYLLLIMHYWQHGNLPTDEAGKARIGRLSGKQWKKNREAIAKLFLPDWKHKRIDVELEKHKIISEKRALAGFKGGSSSRDKNNVERFIAQANAKQTGGQPQPHINRSTFLGAEKGPSGGLKQLAASPELRALISGE